MSSTPVPRRESPWGLPEGDTRQPQPHRCNDRAEDVIQTCKYSRCKTCLNCKACKEMAFSQYSSSKRVPCSACFEGNPFKTVPGPFKLFWRCMRSKPGEEPTEPFTYLQLDPPKRQETRLE